MKIEISLRSFTLAATALLATTIAPSVWASGSSSNTLKAHINLQEGSSVYSATPSQSDDAFVFEVSESVAKAEVTVSLRGEHQSQSLNQKGGAKSAPELDRVTVKRFDETQVSVRFESLAKVEGLAEPVTSDVTVLGKFDVGNWDAFVAGSQTRVIFDSRAQAKLERNLESTLGVVTGKLLMKDLPDSKLKSLSSEIDYAPMALSRQEVSTNATGTIDLTISVPNL